VVCCILMSERTWPLLIGFGVGTLYDVTNWHRCMNDDEFYSRLQRDDLLQRERDALQERVTGTLCIFLLTVLEDLKSHK
jgi:hypothetical protein